MKQFRCDVCDNSFKSAQALRIHQQEHHADPKTPLGKKRITTWAIGAGILLFLAVAASAVVLFQNNPSPASVPPAAGSTRTVSISIKTGTDLGQQAPTFALADLDGNLIQSSEIQGTPTVVYFSASWCLSCVPETQALAKLKANYGPKVNVVWIDINPGRDTPEDLRAYGQKYGHPDFVYALDKPDNELAIAYRVRALGTTYFLDREGIIRYVDYGPTSYERYAQVLQGLL